MNCDAIDELLSDYIDGELADESSAAVKAHLAGCERCAASHRALRRTVRFVRNVGETNIGSAGAARWYSDFTRSMVDETSRRTTADLLREVAWSGGAWKVREEAEGDPQ